MLDGLAERIAVAEAILSEKEALAREESGHRVRLK
jgi:hypothetical protein